MKKLINKLFRPIGLKISRLPKSVQSEAPVYTEDMFLVNAENNLNYYITPSRNCYLPGDIRSDVIVNAMKQGQYFE